MPESEKKARHVKSTVGRLSSGDALKDESSLYGDEADIPLRRKKKASGKAGSAKVGGADSKGAAQKGGRRSAAYPKVAPKKRRVRRNKRRAHKNFYEWMNASESNRLFKPLHIFGREIRIWPLLLLVVILLTASGVMLNNNNIQVTEQTVTIVGLPEDLEGYRIIVLSDMNGKRFGDSQNQLLRTVNNLRYDLIFCVGDMVGKGGNAEPFLEFLEGLRYPERVYFICGDQDPGPYVDSVDEIAPLEEMVLEDWILRAKALKANYVDRPVAVRVKDSTLWISPATMLNLETVSTKESWLEQYEQEYDGTLSGINVDHDSLPFTDYRKQQVEALYDAERAMTVTDIHISLAHESPSDEYIYTSENHGDDERYLIAPELIVAGHYCGGVWRIPLVGPIYVPDRTFPRSGWFPDASRVSGLTTVGDTQVYITRGLSTNGAVSLMPFRLFNGPEVVVLTLTATLPENMLGAR